MIKVFALSGWKQSGKDTTADYLVKKYGFNKLSFASALKDMVADQYVILRNHMDLSEFKESPIKGMPVTPVDDFSRLISNFMVKEFRTINGEKPDNHQYIEGKGFQGVIEVTGQDGTRTKSWEMKDLYWTPRALCILEGSVKRTASSDYWVKKVIESIKFDFEPNPPKQFVISDLRYKSEIKQLRAAFGDSLTVVRINRFKSIDSTDPSERDLDGFDFDITVDSTGTVEDLKADIDKLMLVEKAQAS